MISDELIERRLHELRETIDAHAAALAEKNHLDEFKKSKLAILMKQAEKEGHKTTAAQEREARAHPDYLQLLDGLKAATEESERLRWELELVRIRVSLYQTQQANARAERQGYRG